eukprot:923206_1
MGSVKSLNEQQATRDTIKSGYLLKESKHLKTYRKRFMVLKGSTLISYKTDEQSGNEITELIDLLKYNSLEESSAIIFFIANEHDERAFRAKSKEDMQEWVKSIQYVYQNYSNPFSRGFKLCIAG